MRTLALTLLAAMMSATAGPAPLGDTIVVRDWLLAGPFPVGPREGITGLVTDPAGFRPVPGETLWSPLAASGWTTWRTVESDSLGRLETEYEAVDWSGIREYYGIAGLVNVGHAWAEISLPRPGVALAVTARCGFSINGRGYQGNPYDDPWQATPVLLDSGPNRILLSLSGFGDNQARFLLVPPAAPVQVIGGDLTVPDLPAVDDTGNAGPVLLGIPLLNTTPDYADQVRLRLLARAAAAPADSGKPDSSAFTLVADTTLNRLPPLGVAKLPLPVRLPPGTAELAVLVTANGASHSDTVPVATKEPGEARKVTFRSAIDNSCQYYAVRYPAGYDPSRRYALILALHGAGVRAEDLAATYPPLDWAFVVAPTNRRPYGFDWQDWGRLDALEALEHALTELPVDPDRVSLSGHSMGGHGTWHLGLSRPDRFAAAAVGAGWPSFQLYVPWFLQRSATFARPGQLAVRDRALAPDNVPMHLENSGPLPWFILHGGADDNVPTWHGRSFATWLAERGIEFRYRELPSAGHWWGREEFGETPVGDTALLEFLRDRRREPDPRRVSFRTADLGTSSGAWWLEIERARTVGEFSEIEATAGDSSVTVRTANVEQFRLDLDARLPFPGPVGVEIDGRRVTTVRSLPAHVRFHRRDGQWREGPARLRGPAKTPACYGPAKQAMFRPFLLVHGTADPAQADRLRHEAVQEGLRWWVRGNGRAEVLPDTAVTDSLAAAFNLVLFGGADANHVTRKFAGRLPVQVRAGELRLADRNLGPDLAALFVYPNPANPERLLLVRMGTDAEHTRLAGFWGLLHSGAGIPDFIIFDRSVRRLGWGGVRAAGFFDAGWRFDPASAWLAE
ncbi:MAG: prolyl oligopeptidase family serine peptidase [bacterium]